ncbi:SDR family NAD(P)-dependent oxidoreductase [Microvirga roseola]|uniref:SDR family NAD(P)-dependent oxidoreductase n=1 Tax=Microvirga roseola TaxID=2883126 RepID=UPI001E3E1C3A|nr:glucose 1-dehydrogenase [Microvirga roseola]
MQTSNILAGKTVLVTGGCSGIGQAIAVAAARHGAKAVIVSDTTDSPRDGGDPIAVRIEELGVPARFRYANVAKRRDNDVLVEAACEFDGVDVMVLNAGISLHADGPDVSEGDYRRLMSVNLDGMLLGAQAAACQMRRLRKAGSIVLMSSMAGIASGGKTVAYSTSKGGVILLAKALAGALGPDSIRVNSVAPGVIDTGILCATPAVAAVAEGFRHRTPLRRLGLPAEVGDAVAFLGSDLSSYISGITLCVDGGLLSVI